MEPQHSDAPPEWSHDHVFDTGNAAGEKSTRLVMWITATLMTVEIIAGWKFNSMALMADGWHMSSHAVAIGLSAFAYAFARRHTADRRFAFGTWKIEILAGFASAVFLLGVAGMMVFGSVERFFHPQPIAYLEAMVIAGIGLMVNIACTLILGAAHHGHDHHGHDHYGHDHHGHDHHGHDPHAHHGHDHPAHHDHGHAHDHAHDHENGQGHDHGDKPRHHDLNLKSAYIHVMADAATSVLALLALAGGRFMGWSWLDPVMGIVGAAVVALWARSLIRDTSKVLLDREMDHPVVEEIREVIEHPGSTARLTDLHVWRVGRHAYACALAVATNDDTLTPARIRQQLSVHEEIAHATIEINRGS